MPTPTPSRHHRGAALTALAACTLVLTACAAAPGAAPAPNPTTSTAPTDTSASPSPAVEQPGAVAFEAIKLFARPDEPERRWFAELRPYLDEVYAVEAEYIDPARIPFSEIRSGPKVNGDSDNPQLVTVEFKTDDGTWTVELHQDTPGEEWLVGGIASARK